MVVASFEANTLVEAVPTLIGIYVRFRRILTNHLVVRCAAAGSRVRPRRGTSQQHNIPDVEDSNENTNRGMDEKSDRKI